MGCGAITARSAGSPQGESRYNSPNGDLLTKQGLSRHSSNSSAVAPPQLETWKSMMSVEAKTVELESLSEDLRTCVPARHPQAKLFRKTLQDCLDLLAGGFGGLILAIVDTALVPELQLSLLDNGLLMNLCMEVCPSIEEDMETFEAVLRQFCAHNCSDRWSQHELEALAVNLEGKTADVASLLGPLEGNPKDGAFILSHSGQIAAAGALLRYSSTKYQLLRADGASCGTRHAAALALAEWIGTTACSGAVFVRSDGGGVHAMLPQRGGGPPCVVHFEGLKHPTQEDMLRMFRDRIMERGKLMQKVRQATKSVSGIESTKTSECQDITHTSSKGFELDGMKWVYKITAEDMNLVPTGEFVSSWGALQPMRLGDFLAMPAPEDRAKEICIMDPSALSAYAAMGSEDSGTSNHRTQTEMLEIFKERIKRDGRLMVKVEPCMSRPGKMGERVVTWVNPRVISDVVIQDDTSMVVRAPTMDRELYVLSQEKFLANWIPEPQELDLSNPVNRLLAEKGFKHYRPKPNKKWTYAVKMEDMERIPTGCFRSSWGTMQPVQAGDFLAMPESANEIYLMPKEVLTCYREAGSMPTSTPRPSTPQHRPQEEMVRIFTDRIRARGRIAVKAKPGMLRPGRRGERVVTYVDGRVISDTVITNDTSMVVRAPTLDHEEYVLSRQKFEANWEPQGEPLDENEPELKRLSDRGFRLHRPKPVQKRVYRVDDADLQLVPTGWFYAAWGALQPLSQGDYLAMPVDREPEVYLMPAEVLSCYTVG